jgi:Amt family ammonium transporter
MGWCFQWAFCAAFVAIVNGSLLERAKIELYLILVPILAAVIYPVVVGWTWGNGWLA